MEQSLTGRVAFVTGAGGGDRGGIGAGIARALARHGCQVMVNDLTHESTTATVRQIAELGGQAKEYPVDITDSEAVDRYISEVVRDYGRLDIVVNNAGITGLHAVAATKDDEWAAVIGVNLTGAFYVSRAAIPNLVATGAGRIINVASIAGLRVAQLGGAAYTASKAGLLGFTRHLAVELASQAVTVNAICPGLTDTPLVQERTSEEGRLESIAMIPTQSAGKPDDIGELAVFLAGPHAHYITGAEIVHDGGKSVLQGDYGTWKRLYPMVNE